MGIYFLNKQLITSMKFAVVLALAAADADAADAAASEFCTCDATCALCKADGLGEDGAPTEGTACFTCADGGDVTEATEGDGFGTCAAAEGGDDEGDDEGESGLNDGKAGLGQECDSDGANHGCADGHRCGTTPVEGVDDVPEICVLSEACIEPIVCGAKALGATLVAAVAIASSL